MKSNLEHKKINHISFIMDGNGRWAKKRLLPRTAGHKAGVTKAKEIVLAVKEFGIPYASMYTFSKENWRRPDTEVSFLMGLMISHLETEFNFYIENQIKIVHIGDRNGLPGKVLKAIDKVADDTKNFTSLTLLLAINYSGKYDILQAIQQLQQQPEFDLNETTIDHLLLTAGYPDPDLIIRTSGEFRISNYFLWQSAYSEFYISEKLWPDFTKADLALIIDEYLKRERRYGGIKNE